MMRWYFHCMAWKRSVIALMALTIVGCTSSSDGIEPEEPLSLSIEFEDLSGVNSIRTELAEARERWVAADIDSYRIEVTETQNYWTNGCQWITAIENGAAIEISLAPSSPDSTSGTFCAETEWNVPKLHSLISRFADAVDESVGLGFDGHTLEIDFDDDGVPQAVRFDLSNGDDEESTLLIRFTPAESPTTTSEVTQDPDAPQPMDNAGNIAIGETRTRRVSTHCGMNILFWDMDGSQWFAINPIESNSSKDLPNGWVDDGQERIELEFERVSKDTIIARPVGTEFSEEYRRATDQDPRVGCD